jgi:hypothetical protein
MPSKDDTLKKRIRRERDGERKRSAEQFEIKRAVLLVLARLTVEKGEL